MRRAKSMINNVLTTFRNKVSNVIENMKKFGSFPNDVSNVVGEVHFVVNNIS